MKHQPRSVLALVLVALLVLTGQSMAVARGLPGPAGQMVICTGSGPVMVTLDDSGVPAGPAHICPEAALTLIQMAFDSPAPELRVTVTPTVYLVAVKQPGQQKDTWQALARGPPSSA